MLYQQHDAQWIDPGSPGQATFTVFNNGLGRNYSSVDEITPPVDASGNYTSHGGSGLWPDEFHLVVLGHSAQLAVCRGHLGRSALAQRQHPDCDGTHGTFIEVTSARKLSGNTSIQSLRPAR